jgi:rhodanese-related sulfurtransferase
MFRLSIWGTVLCTVLVGVTKGVCAVEDTPRAAIGAYLAESPVENFRVKPDAVSDDPRDDFYVVLDVRSRDEFVKGRIAGAINVPYQELVGHLDALPAGPDDAVLIYCETTTRSTQALMALRLLGYRKVSYLAGGINRWQKDGRPVQAGE